MKPVEQSDAWTAAVTDEQYLMGNYRPVHQELSSGPLRITGELPADLQGMYVSNSSNPKFRPKNKYHWFDGDGMVHGVLFRDGEATYRNRYVRTEGLQREEEAGAALFTGIRDRPDWSSPEGPFKDNANTDLAFHAGRLLALWWLGGKARQLRLPELETVGNCDFGGQLTSGMSAHPKVDPVTGEMIYFDYGLTPPFLLYGVISPEGNVVHHTPIDLPGPRAQHDIAITENYTLLFDVPMYFDPMNLKQGRLKTVFNRSMPSRIGVLPRHSTEPRWFETEAFYMYHTINAYEEDDAIVLIGCRIESPMTDDHPDRAGRVGLGFLDIEPYLTRWRLDLTNGNVTTEILDDVPTEFPRTNDALLGRKQRFSYNPRVSREPTLLFDGFIKYDIASGQSWKFEYGRRRWGGETTFVPRPDGTAEDDGYVLTYLSDEIEDSSELLVFDAQDVSRGPLASVALPHRLPALFHAQWVSAEDIANQKLS